MTGAIDGLGQAFVVTHVLAIVALGLMAAQGAWRLPGAILVTFALGFGTGAMLIAFAMRETPAASVLLAIAAAAGIIVILAWTAPLLIRHALAFAAGTALALNSPPQAISIPSAIASQVATGAVALVMLAVVASIAMNAERQWQRVGVRIAASWIAASAILVLALRLMR